MDTTHQISSVERTLGARTLPAGEARVLTIAQTYPTTYADLWDAVTSIERIPRWFLPISGELRLGGRYQFEGNAGGTIEECDPPNSFVVTWEMWGQISWVTVTVTPVDAEHTRFHLEHVAHVDQNLWEQYGPSAVGIGWDSGLLGLALYLTAPDQRPEDPMAWQVSEEGKQFCRLSADAWRDAHIASGADPALAQRTADATWALYTTMPEENAAEE